MRHFILWQANSIYPELNIDPIIFRVEGEGGRGGSVVGEILARSAARAGYSIQCSRAFPAEIKGGRAWFQLKIASQPQTWWGGTPDLEMTDGKGGEWVIRLRNGGGAVVSKTSFLALAKSSNQPRNANIIALGFLAETLGLEAGIVSSVAEKRLSRRAEGDHHLKAALEVGREAAIAEADWPRRSLTAPENPGRRLVLTGNEAIALGALAAGVRFFCGYPITPASSILEVMLRELPNLGGTAIQMEDEISAFGACLGASYAGKRAMVATSGPGFALMSEMMNLAVMAELPITVVDVQRSGPATGQPSKSEQADLLYALYGSPGDSPRLALAPATVEEAFHMTIKAVNLAEKYQTPVVLLSDAALSNRIEAIPEPDWARLPRFERSRPPSTDLPDFQRYLPTSTGVSPMPLPGEDDLPYIAAGMEHQAAGSPSGSAETHSAMSRKRLGKIEAAREILSDEPDYSVHPKARIGIVGWGSTYGAIAEAAERLRRDGANVAVAHIRHLNPMPEERLTRWMAPLDRIIVAEDNQMGQLASLIRRFAPGKIESLLPSEEFELTPERVIDFIKPKAYNLAANG